MNAACRVSLTNPGEELDGAFKHNQQGGEIQESQQRAPCGLIWRLKKGRHSMRLITPSACSFHLQTSDLLR